MLILPKHSIDKKSTFLHVLPNTYAILKSDDFKNTIFKNAIFKIALIEIALPNGPLVLASPIQWSNPQTKRGLICTCEISNVFKTKISYKLIL
jgi:hypothetical protein